MAANIFQGTINNNWSNAGNWSLGAIPTANDGNTATFDATSPNCTVDGANRVCNSIDFTGYINTITMTFNITSSGSVTLDAGMGIAGSGILTVNATATLTSNGRTWPNGLTFGGASTTITLADNWTVSGNFLPQGSASLTINGNTINIGANLTMGAQIVAGTANIVMNGTGTWSGSGGGLRCNLEFNTAGTITVSGSVVYLLATLTYTSGTMVVTGSTLTITSTTTLDTDGMTWNNVTLSTGGSTITLLSDFNIGGLFTIGGAAGTFNGFNLNLSGGLTHASSSNFVGTTVIVFNGTGTWQHTSSGAIANSVTINTAGTITFGTTISYRTGTLTYISGTVITAGNTFTIAATAPTLNTNGTSDGTGTTTSSTGINFNNFTCNISFTNNSNMCVISTFNMNPGGGAAPVVSASNVYIQGNYTQTGNAAAGTSLFTMNGTGTLSSVGASSLQNSFTINTSGVITLGTGLVFSPTGGGKTFTYTAGTVITTGNTFTVSTANTLNTAGIIWNNFTTAVQGTLTLTSLLTMIGTLTVSTSGVGCTWAGTAGWTCATFTATVAGITHTYTVGNTYTVTSAFTITAATNASRISFRSSSAGTKAVFILNVGATQNVGYVNATDIDSNPGQTIYSFNGVITTTFNWSTLTFPRPSSFVFEH